jgi:hypothetical protein
VITSSLLDDHKGTLNHAESNSGVRLGDRVLSSLPLWVRLLVDVGRNLPARIRWEYKTLSGFWLGSPVLPKGYECFAVFGPSNHIHAYIQDMQRLRVQFPFLTHFDLCVATLAWKAGTQRSSDSGCTEVDRNTWGADLASSQNGSTATVV